MYVRNEVPVEALLKGSAAKVLLHLLAHRGESLSNHEIMRGSGVHDRNTFFAAKKQLQEYGLWENPDRFFHTVGGNTHTVGENPPTVGENTHTTPPTGPLPTPDLEAMLALMRQGAAGVAMPRITARLDAEVVREEKVPDQPPPLTVGAEGPLPEPERDYRADCMRADLMDASGDTHASNSPINERTRAQIQALQWAFQGLFHRPLQERAAKRWLQLTDHSAEDALDTIEYTHARFGEKMESPFAYIEKVLANKRDERKRQPAAQTAARPEGEDTYYLSEPTERTKRIQERLRAAGIRFAGDGLGPDPDEEDDE